jgi:hypothetical protein
VCQHKGESNSLPIRLPSRTFDLPPCTAVQLQRLQEPRVLLLRPPLSLLRDRIRLARLRHTRGRAKERGGGRVSDRALGCEKPRSLAALCAQRLRFPATGAGSWWQERGRSPGEERGRTGGGVRRVCLPVFLFGTLGPPFDGGTGPRHAPSPLLGHLRHHGLHRWAPSPLLLRRLPAE